MCADTDCLPMENCQESDLVMHNDGSGVDISIPVVLLWKEAGDDIHNHIVMKGHSVWMEVHLDYVNFPTTSYQVWTTLTDSLSHFFLNSVDGSAVVIDCFKCCPPWCKHTLV